MKTKVGFKMSDVAWKIIKHTIIFESKDKIYTDEQKKNIIKNMIF